jgi:predicted CopG family antitoxin
MATKTISIDLEAYERLKGRKKEGESFSQAIKRLVPKPFDYKKWLDDLARNPISNEAADAIEEVVRQRRAPQNVGKYYALSGHHRVNRSGVVKKKGRATKGGKNARRSHASR